MSTPISVGATTDYISTTGGNLEIAYKHNHQSGPSAHQARRRACAIPLATLNPRRVHHRKDGDVIFDPRSFFYTTLKDTRMGTWRVRSAVYSHSTPPRRVISHGTDVTPPPAVKPRRACRWKSERGGYLRLAFASMPL
ncbi:hypothetical protein NMY22_g15815 [Coprinellus aureogranulatus]|nr:hypothetical protein NMY22_g15815 [Coprinellus aureogranulatus]